MSLIATEIMIKLEEIAMLTARGQEVEIECIYYLNLL